MQMLVGAVASKAVPETFTGNTYFYNCTFVIMSLLFFEKLAFQFFKDYKHRKFFLVIGRNWPCLSIGRMDRQTDGQADVVKYVLWIFSVTLSSWVR